MQIEKALINNRLRVLKISRKFGISTIYIFCCNLPVKFLKRSLLFNSFYCLFCLLTKLDGSKTKTAINVKISVLVIFVEAIIYFLLYNLHDCTSETIVKEIGIKYLNWTQQVNIGIQYFRDEQSFIQLSSKFSYQARINNQFISQDLLVDVQHVVTDYAIIHFNTATSNFQQQNTTLLRLQDQSIATSSFQDQNITMSSDNRQLYATVPVFSLAALNIRVENLTFLLQYPILLKGKR